MSGQTLDALDDQLIIRLAAWLSDEFYELLNFLESIINRKIDYNRLVVLQTVNQCEVYSRNERKQGDLILTIGADAMWYVAKYQWDSFSLRDVFDMDEYKASHKESNRKIEDLISRLNDWSADNKLEMGNYYGFQLWIIIGQIHYNYFILKSIAKNVGEKPILIYTKKNEETILELRPDPERVFFNVLAHSNLLAGIKAEVVLVDEKRRSTAIKEKTLNSLPITVLRILRFLRDGVRLSQCNDKSKQRLLLIGGGYDWFQIAKLLKFKKEYCVKIATPLFGRRSVKQQDKKLSKILDDSVTFDDDKTYDLKKLKSAIQQDCQLFAKKKKRVQALIKGYEAVVTGVLTYPLDLFYAHVAVEGNKKLFVWQHGEKGQGTDYSSNFTELYYATDYLSYAPVVSEMYQEFVGKRWLKRVHTVGAISRNIEWQGGGGVVYATGKWFGTAVPFLDKCDPDQRLFKAHRTILDYLNSVGKKKEVIFKPNNTFGFDLIRYQYNNIKTEYNRSFTELLRTASVVVLDTPATTLVEACSTKVPIFVLGGRSKYLPEFMQAIQQRVAWYETPEELVEGLSRYFSMGAYNADVNSKSYINGYSLQISKDDVCENLLQALK